VVIISKIEHWTENLELIRPYRIAYETISSVENHFVLLETDEGAFGIGSASPSPEVTGESIEDCQAALDDNLDSLLLNHDIEHWKHLCHQIQISMSKTPAARAACDIALHDLAAKLVELPLVELLGQVHHSMPTSITIGIQSIEESLAEAEEYLGRGFRILKLKTGVSWEADVECLQKIREKVGRDVKIRVDANQGYSAGEYEKFSDQTNWLDIELVEQALPATSDKKMLDLPERIRMRSVADESLVNEEDAARLAQSPRAFGIFNIKLMKCGGITPALQIAHMAEKAGIDLMWGCNDESIVSITAALHAAFSSSATKYLDLDGSLDLAKDVVKDGFFLENGKMELTANPGLGVNLI
jgi:L-Ala-D/L-Glu epimerase